MQERKGSEGASLTFIFVTLLIDILGFGLVIPIIPNLIERLTHTGASEASGYYGWLLASYGLMQFFFAPVLGSLSDKVGRRPVLLASLACNGFDYFVMALAPTIGWLFMSRIVSGIAGASFTAATAYIADISPPEKRAQNFGIIGAAFGIGFIVGPAVGGLLGSIDSRLPFWAAGALSLANFFYGYFIVPESLKPENRREFSWKSANPVGSLNLLGRYRGTMLLGLMFVFSGLAQQALQSTWVLFTTFRFNWSTAQNGFGLALVGLVAGGVQAGLSRVIIPKVGEGVALLVGLGITCIGYVLLGTAAASWMMYATIVIWGLGSIANPASQSIVSKAYGPDEQGAIQGAVTSIQSLTGIVGPIAATALFGFFTSSKAPAQVPGAAFLFAAFLVLISLWLAQRALRKPELAGAITEAA